MGKLVMTVDDSTTIRRMVAFALKEAGHQVVEAEDGIEGLTLLKAQKIDLIISDLNMPKMGGLELTRQVRGLPEYGKIPIILLTTESGPIKKAEGKAAGANGWIVKPFTSEQLHAVLARIFPNG